MRTNARTTCAALFGAVLGALATNCFWVHTPVVRAEDPTGPKCVSAERFELRDNRGRMVGAWDAGTDGPSFHVRRPDMNGGFWIGFDENGGLRVTLEKSNDPVKTVFDPQTKKMMELAKAEQPSVTIRVDKDGTGAVEVRDARGTLWASPGR